MTPSGDSYITCGWTWERPFDVLRCKLPHGHRGDHDWYSDPKPPPATPSVQIVSEEWALPLVDTSDNGEQR